MTSTIVMRNAVITASSRRLNICAWTLASFSAATVPAASSVASFCAPARKPSFGSLDHTFCQPAVMVTARSHASGRSVVHA